MLAMSSPLIAGPIARALAQGVVECYGVGRCRSLGLRRLPERWYLVLVWAGCTIPTHGRLELGWDYAVLQPRQ